MRLDFSYTPNPYSERVVVEARRGHRFETWAIEGSVGDRVMVDFYLPEEVDRVVVMGHGADNSRAARYIQVSGKSFTRRGTAVVAMDAPSHGDRLDAVPLTEPVGTLTDVLVQWVRDHRRLLDVTAERFPGTPIGFAGFSMGGLYGVPLAAVDDRLRSVAVIIAGSTAVSYPIRFGGLAAEAQAAVDLCDPAAHAAAVGSCPVMLLNADRDELVPREAAIALYDAFIGPKELVFMPGTHTEWRHAARWFRRLEAFFVDTLR